VSSLTRCARVGQRVGAADDLADFLGDLGLPCVVRLTGQRLEQIVRVVVAAFIARRREASSAAAASSIA
jgi:hypothetical protein